MAAIETSVRATAALDDLYRRHVGDVYRYCYAVLGNHADAEDVTQTTFVNALRALERGEEPRNPNNWLLVIAHNIVRQRWRQAAVRPAEVELMHDVADTSSENDVELDGLVRALQRIPPAQREALVMRELEGRSYSEITELLGLTTSALETLLFRARRSLAEELENVVTCQSAELAMSQRLDQRLSRKESRRLDEHLAECATCAHLAETHARQRRAFKGLAVLPLPIGLALFKGAPTAAAAASLPTIGATSSGGTGLGTATAAGGATGAGGAATGGGLAVGGSLLGGAVAKVAAVLIAGVIVTATAYEGAKLITGNRESSAATRSEEAVKGAFANEAASAGMAATAARVTGDGSASTKAPSPTAHGGHGATVDDTASASAGTGLADAGTPGTGGTHAGNDGQPGAPTNGSDGASGSDSPSTPPAGGPGKGTDAPAAPPANGPQGAPNAPADPGAGGNKPATTGKPPVTTRPASTAGGATSHPASKPKKPKKPKKKVAPVGPQANKPPQAANPQGPGSSDEHVPPGQAKQPDEPAKTDNAPKNGADNPGLKTGLSPENSAPGVQAGNAASDATSSQGSPPAANPPATPSVDTSASPSPPADSSSEKLHGYDKPKK